MTLGKLVRALRRKLTPPGNRPHDPDDQSPPNGESHSEWPVGTHDIQFPP